MKKFLSVICSLAVLATCGVSTVFASAEEPVTKINYILGDINGDGKVDPKDAVEMLITYASYMADISKYDGKASVKDVADVTNEMYYDEKGDINGDGKITSQDAVYALYYYGYNLTHPDSTMTMEEYYKLYKATNEKGVDGDVLEKVQDEASGLKENDKDEYEKIRDSVAEKANVVKG